MKNKRGEIATLLTLGLVIVGTLVALGTSLFVSNKKTNLASNSRAAGCYVINQIDATYARCPAYCGALASGTCVSYEHNSPDKSCSSCGGPAATSAPAATSVPAQTSGECQYKGPNCNNGTLCMAPKECKSQVTGGVRSYCCPQGVNPPPLETEPTAVPGTPVPTAVPTSRPTGGCSPGTYVSGSYYKCAAYCGLTSTGSCVGYEHNSTDSSCAYCGTASVPTPTSGTVAPTAPLGRGCGSGHAYPCDPAQGYNLGACPQESLEFNCCIEDRYYCNGESRYRWYGCTGQPCSNTRISQSNGPNTLVACPGGVNRNNTSAEQGICSSQAGTPAVQPTSVPGAGPTGLPTGIPVAFTPESTCNASGTAISFSGCNYYESSGSQPCSSSTPIYNSGGCVVYRACRGTDCQYDCYKDGTHKNCIGADDPNTNYDFVRIINSSSNPIIISRIIIEKMQIGSNPVSDQGGITLNPAETKVIDLNNLGGDFACSAVSANSIKAILFDENGAQLAEGQDGCGGGVKILIILK